MVSGCEKYHLVLQKRNFTTLGTGVSRDLVKSVATALKNIFSGGQRNASAVRLSTRISFSSCDFVSGAKSDACTVRMKPITFQFSAFGKASRSSEMTFLTSGDAVLLATLSSTWFRVSGGSVSRYFILHIKVYTTLHSYI